MIAETASGSVACFPPPHQFFFPRDLTDNLKTVWYGREHRGLDARFGFGIRQAERGGGSFVPWFNAPPGTDQQLRHLYLLSDGDAERALRKTLRYTHGDRYLKLPGYHTFTSHWHMATTMAALQEKSRGGPRSIPDSVRMFKDMGVEIAHLAEFHGDGHPQDHGPLRACRKWRRCSPSANACPTTSSWCYPAKRPTSPWARPARARNPATGCISFPSQSTGR